jgi:ribosomal protein L16 Arg81 hydroxylase
MDTSLSSLLGHADAELFMQRHWPERAFVVHRKLEDLPAVLRPELVLDPAQLTRIYRGIVEVTNGKRGQFRLTGADPSVYFDVLDLAARFSELDSYLPGATPWLRAFEKDLGVPEGAAQLHAFINAENIGLFAHCDPTEHIVIQLAGTKTFRLHENPLTRHPSMSHSAEREPTRHALAQATHGFPDWPHLPDSAETVELKPGSVLFMPRGMYHETRGGKGGRSVTLVIQVAVPNYAQLLTRYLSDYLAQSPAWREPAVGGWSTDTSKCDLAAERLAELIAELTSGKHPISPEHVLRHAHGGISAQAFEWGAFLQRNPACRASLHMDGEAVVVRAGDKEVRLDAEAHEVLSFLLDRRERFDFGELCRVFGSWDERALAMMCRFLVNARALLVLPLQRYPVDVPSAG